MVPEFAVQDLPSAELQPRFLRLQGRTCPWAEHSDDDDDDDDVVRNIGLEVNSEKTKYMITSRHQNLVQNRNVVLGNLLFENVV